MITVSPTLKISVLFFFFFCLFRAAPVACGGSQARGLIQATAAGLHQSHSLQPTSQPHQIQAASATYTTARGNTRSLTH